jgi:hypothetical protein
VKARIGGIGSQCFDTPPRWYVSKDK